jgi:catechol-2,3-dioxygenase
MATKGPQDRLAGIAFAMDPSVSLQAYVKKFNAKWLDGGQIPGGGVGVELFDPSGRSVWLLQGQQELPERTVRQATTSLTNDGQIQRRINGMVRTPAEVPEVLRLGHVVFQTVNFEEMQYWYMQVIGMIPTDVQYLADGTPTLAFNRLDLGTQPADHHTLVLIGAIEEKYEHSAYELVDLDALGQGQQIMHANGYRHMWGLGRHLIGSQLFDYWFDPDGFEYEHYTDGDLFTSDFETLYSAFEFGGIWSWGQDAPKSMKPKKDLKSLLRIAGLLWRKKLTVQRLKLVSQALDAPARPWL